MLWIIVLIVVVWLASISAGFRKFALSIVVLAIIGAVVLWGWIQADNKRRAREEVIAKSLIPPTNVELVDLRMGLDSSSTRLSGRVRNNDPRHVLTGVELRLTIRECDLNGRCDTIGDEAESVSVEVPPHQARDFERYVWFNGLRTGSGKRDWSYQLVSVSGK